MLIHPIDELNLELNMEELGKVALIANKEYEELNIEKSSLWECKVKNIFFIVIDGCKEKLVLCHTAKCDSIQGLLTDCFCLII